MVFRQWLRQAGFVGSSGSPGQQVQGAQQAQLPPQGPGPGREMTPGALKRLPSARTKGQTNRLSLT